MSSGERRLLAIAASLAGEQDVRLNDAVSGLDRDSLTLVLAALSHANGSHQAVDLVPDEVDGDGRSVVSVFSPRVQLGAVVDWPPHA